MPIIFEWASYYCTKSNSLHAERNFLLARMEFSACDRIDNANWAQQWRFWSSRAARFLTVYSSSCSRSLLKKACHFHLAFDLRSHYNLLEVAWNIVCILCWMMLRWNRNWTLVRWDRKLVMWECWQCSRECCCSRQVGSLDLAPGSCLIHIWRCRRLLTCRSRWSPYH